jgi:chromatin structure-remodeling complex subunit SFH1
MISYAEHGSDEDDEDEEEEEESEPEAPESDPEDGSYGGRGGRKRERRETYQPQTANGGYDNAKQGRLKKKRDEMDRGWTWLGDRCPGERVRSQRAPGTKHQYLCVGYRVTIRRKLTCRSQETLDAEADKLEALVPITIDFDVPSPNPEHAGIKIKDRFLWNLHGRSSRVLA